MIMNIEISCDENVLKMVRGTDEFNSLIDQPTV